LFFFIGNGGHSNLMLGFVAVAYKVYFCIVQRLNVSKQNHFTLNLLLTKIKFTNQSCSTKRKFTNQLDQNQFEH